MIIYDFILQGHDATEQNARAAISGLDWQAIETQQRPSKFQHSEFKFSKDGIDVYYDYAADYYYFVDATENENN